MAHNADSLVKAFLEPWNRHDVEGAVSMMAADCIWEYPAGSDPWGRRFSGSNELRAAIAEVFNNVPDINYEVVRYYPSEQHVVMELLVTGTRSDGTSLKYQVCDIITVEEGKVVAKRTYRKVLPISDVLRVG